MDDSSDDDGLNCSGNSDDSNDQQVLLGPAKEATEPAVSEEATDEGGRPTACMCMTMITEGNVMGIADHSDISSKELPR